MRKSFGVDKQKGPDPCGIQASANRDSRVCAYALASPGCNWSSFRSSPIAGVIENAGTNATRPCMGRLLVTMGPNFTMKLSKKWCSLSEGGGL